MPDDKLIRKRASYKLYRALAELHLRGSLKDVLAFMHKKLDRHHVYGSRHKASCAIESIELVLKDFCKLTQLVLKGEKNGNRLGNS